MNYIKHLNTFFDIMYDDERLSGSHITLYIALFQQWNIKRFKNPITFVRKDIMRTARIGSLTTYTRCMRDLHDWQYLEYMPSHNPQGATINLYSLCTSIDTSNCTSSRTPDVQPSVQLLYINKNKHIKQYKEESNPTQDEVLFFFKEKEWEVSEANKFFFHYEATGWRMRNQSKILDWHAAAEKWIINKSAFSDVESNRRQKQQLEKPGKLHVTTNKNYSEPL